MRAQETMFDEIDIYEAVAAADAPDLDPDDFAIVFNDSDAGCDLAGAIEEMARDTGDNAYPVPCLRAAPALDGFTMALCHADMPGRVLSTLTAEIGAEDDRLEVFVEMIFTDAEFRGEGLGRVMAAAMDIMVGRAIDAWTGIPRSDGDEPGSVVVVADTISPGGQTLVERIRDDAVARVAGDMEEIPEPA